MQKSDDARKQWLTCCIITDLASFFRVVVFHCFWQLLLKLLLLESFKSSKDVALIAVQCCSDMILLLLGNYLDCYGNIKTMRLIFTFNWISPPYTDSNISRECISSFFRANCILLSWSQTNQSSVWTSPEISWKSPFLTLIIEFNVW